VPRDAAQRHKRVTRVFDALWSCEAVRCRAGAVQSAMFWYDPVREAARRALHRARDTRAQFQFKFSYGLVPGRSAARSDALQSRGRTNAGVWYIPGSAKQHFVLHRARETSNGKSSN